VITKVVAVLAGPAAAQARRFGSYGERPYVRTVGSQRVIDQAINSSIAHRVQAGQGNDHDRSEADKLASPELKNVAKLPATAVTTKMPHASSPTSIIFPTDVTGFVILDETVSNCTPQKKAESPNPWIFPPFCPLSNTHMSTVQTAKTTIDSPNAITKRANSRRCRSPIVKSLDNSSRITAESPSALRSCARGVR
jgi:hypothetical protein